MTLPSQLQTYSYERRILEEYLNKNIFFFEKTKTKKTDQTEMSHFCGFTLE